MNQFTLTSLLVKELKRKDVTQRGRKGKPLTIVQVEVRAEIKMFHIEQSKMNWVKQEEGKEKSMDLWLR